jgi:hypothetical protein
MQGKDQRAWELYHKRVLILPKGIEAATDEDNAEYWENTTKKKAEVDLTALDEIHHQQITEYLGNTPSHEEISNAWEYWQNNKAPGASGMATDMIKNLLLKAFLIYSKLKQEFWNKEDTDFTPWHETLLATVYKGKGEPPTISHQPQRKVSKRNLPENL